MNCIIIDADPATRNSLEVLVRKNKNAELLGCYADVLSATDIVINGKSELIFLGMNSHNSSDIGFIRELSRTKPHFIILSEKIEAAKDAFDSGAADFILKPLSEERLNLAIAKAMHIIPGNNHFSGDHLFVKVNSRLVKLDLKEVFLVEALSDYIILHLADKKYTVHSTMKGIESILPDKDFARVHNSYIVRIDKISEIEGNTLAVEKRIIPISISYRKNLLKHLRII